MENDIKQKLINDFDLYLQKFECVNQKSRGNYLSWARFLLETHDLESIKSDDDIKRILHIERGLQMLADRKKYKSAKDIGNFRSTLNRFLPFIKIWQINKSKLEIVQGYDDMIDLIEKQACSEHALTMFNAILYRAFQDNYLFSENQKNNMSKGLAKFNCMINADKLFMPGSTYNPK